MGCRLPQPSCRLLKVAERQRTRRAVRKGLLLPQVRDRRFGLALALALAVAFAGRGGQANGS